MIKPPPASFSDSAKARWNQSMRNMSGILGIGGTTSPQMSAHDLLLNASNKPRGKTSKVAVSGKDPAEMLHGRVSSTNTNGSSSTDVLAPLRQGGSANNSSGNVVGLVQSMTSPVVSPRDPKDSQKEAQRNRRKSRDGLDLAAVPSGILINSALTTNTLAKIEAASPIEAWHSQPTGRGKAAPSSKQVSNVEVFDAEGTYIACTALNILLHGVCFSVHHCQVDLSYCLPPSAFPGVCVQTMVLVVELKKLGEAASWRVPLLIQRTTRT